MSEAPKKIWVDDEVLWGSALELQSDYKKETAYIRADIVEELVEAAEVLLRSLDWDSEVKEKNWWFEARAKSRAALKKLEDV